MFIQVMHGTAAEEEAIQEALEYWLRELAPEAHGWLGTTSGLTEDGRFIAVVRFESEELARRNSERPEQGRWWEDTSKLFVDEVTFHDCTQVETFREGGSDDAGFVQIIQSGVRDAPRLRELMKSGERFLADFRPDVIGGTYAFHDDEEGMTMTVYFPSEAAAREREQKEPTPEIRELMDEQMKHYVGEPLYFDLRTLWLHSPR
jgi:hypothetical protein